MSKLSRPVSDALMRHLERRMVKLVQSIETSTRLAEDRAIRETGSELVDRIHELWDDLLELRRDGDEHIMEAIDVFHRRLFLAQRKVDSWPSRRRDKKHAA